MKKVPRQQVCFFLLLAVSLLVGWRPLADTFELALRDDAYTYILLILPISVGLILLEWGSLKPLVTPNVRAGCVLLAMAFLAAASTTGRPTSLPSDVRLSIRIFALVLSWIGVFILSFGSRASRSALFPLCFLFGLVPLPQFVLNEIVRLLQQGSAFAAYALFAAAGVPVAHDGVMLTVPGLTVEVAKECSSIRSSSLLLVTTIVLAQLFLRSPWRRVLVIGASVLLSVAKNGLRIFTIVMLGTRVNPGYLTGRFHREGGIVFFLVALIGIFVLLWILRPRENLSQTRTVCVDVAAKV